MKKSLFLMALVFLTSCAVHPKPEPKPESKSNELMGLAREEAGDLIEKEIRSQLVLAICDVTRDREQTRLQVAEAMGWTPITLIYFPLPDKPTLCINIAKGEGLRQFQAQSLTPTAIVKPVPVHKPKKKKVESKHAPSGSTPTASTAKTKSWGPF